MEKQTKLSEKMARIPDIRQSQWQAIIESYLTEVEPLNNESARSMRFGIAMQELLGIQPNFVESYISGVEKYLKVKQKDRILKGKADNLFGNIIIEFEANIPKKLDEAKEQLQRYIAILWSQEPIDNRTLYIGIATDGVRFMTYSPTLNDPVLLEIKPDDVNLNILEEVDWTKLKPEEIFYWLDRYFLRKEILHPTSETIVKDFGVKSHSLQSTTNTLLTLWQKIKSDSVFAVVYESWEKYLRIVYGSEIANDELFIRHTYLATLAKLMSWMRMTESNSLPENDQIIQMLEGGAFKAQGIENFIEEDFFSWLARDEAKNTGIDTVRWLFSLLKNYNLRELSEDVLKSLYQELVDPETRHDLGEFYTPDWLAHRIVNKLLDENPHGSMLDPSCGSGTFLYLSIKEKRERLGNSLETLHHILESVYGADIHPLAVIIAKTNYILALGDLLKKRKGSITIPIYLADTLKLPERFMSGPEYEIKIDSRTVMIHKVLLENLMLYDQAIELAKEFARQNKGKEIKLNPFHSFLVAQHFSASDNDTLVQSLFKITNTLKYFIDNERDTIWAFILKNFYKPLFFRRKFDFIIGNPPWIAFRFMEPLYQTFLKHQITKIYKLLIGRGEFITHLEIASLFLVRTADLYLKAGGTIAFVLPRSLFTSDQHDGIRKRSFYFNEHVGYNLFWREIWDCEDVTPLFKVPACVLMADKCETAKMIYPVAGKILKGKLEKKNASLEESEDKLTIEDVEFSLHERGKRTFWGTGKDTGIQNVSYYQKQFFQGASIVPRSFWFVEMSLSPLGFNPDLPPLETAKRAVDQAKDAYKSVFFKDTVENRFLYTTLLSTDLVPFGYMGYRLVVLPIEQEKDHYKLINAKEAHESGYLHLARWLKKAEEEWTNRRGAKAKQMNIYERLDRVHGLTQQNPQAKYRVIYNTSGTFLTSAMVKNEPIKFEIDGQEIKAEGFLADTKTYYMETANSDEAYYLSVILNAPEINTLIKPMQSRGLWGPRDIHKKVLDLPIPKFDDKNTIHLQLTKLGEGCHVKVKQWLADGGAGNIKSIGKLRSMVRKMLKDELSEIDVLVKQILERSNDFEQKISQLRDAMKDELSLNDLKEISEDFEAIDLGKQKCLTD